MLQIVIDTNIWIRILLGGSVTLPILSAWQTERFQLISSHALLEEYDNVWHRPRLQRKIDPRQAEKLYRQIRSRAEIVELKTIPPRCRDPKAHPVLATAIDGQANAIVTGDDDLRADDELRNAMAGYGVQLWGVEALLDVFEER